MKTNRYIFTYVKTGICLLVTILSMPAYAALHIESSFADTRSSVYADDPVLRDSDSESDSDFGYRFSGDAGSQISHNWWSSYAGGTNNTQIENNEISIYQTFSADVSICYPPHHSHINCYSYASNETEISFRVDERTSLDLATHDVMAEYDNGNGMERPAQDFDVYSGQYRLVGEHGLIWSLALEPGDGYLFDREESFNIQLDPGTYTLTVTSEVTRTDHDGYHYEYDDVSSWGYMDLTLSAETIPPVPLPAAVWFFIPGVLSLIGFARKRA